jgi:hypothetical protein
MVYKDLKKYDGHTQIQNPHDPEARYSRKRKFEWLGDKVQVTNIVVAWKAVYLHWCGVRGCGSADTLGRRNVTYRPSSLAVLLT